MWNHTQKITVKRDERVHLNISLYCATEALYGTAAVYRCNSWNLLMFYVSNSIDTKSVISETFFQANLYWLIVMRKF